MHELGVADRDFHGLPNDLQKNLSAWTAKLEPAGIPRTALNERKSKWYPHFFSVRESPKT